jgi:hypothetical protein
MGVVGGDEGSPADAELGSSVCIPSQKGNPHPCSPDTTYIFTA